MKTIKVNGEVVRVIEQPEEFFVQQDNIFIKRIWLKSPGDMTYGHSHTFDHVSLLARGMMLVEVEGVKTVYVAPANMLIKAGLHHKMTALEANTISYCIHDTKGLPVDDLAVPFEYKE